MKKSIEESTGEESGVEIVENRPYENGPGGNGQYTLKIYRIASHLPSWFRNLVPKNALSVTEKSWNAYPYTKTTYEVSFASSFKLELETFYYDDAGERNGLFTLSPDEKKYYSVDYIDVVNDPLENKEDEDLKTYVSQVTGRGPLKSNWIEEYKEILNSNKEVFYENCATKEDVNKNRLTKPLPKKIMCAYKLCRIEFKYWGIQSKGEQFIQDVALRKTLVRAHRQSWVWQDEWYGLTMNQIRELEVEAKRLLEQKLKGSSANGETASDDKSKRIKEKSSDSGGQASEIGVNEMRRQRMSKIIKQEEIDAIEIIMDDVDDDDEDGDLLTMRPIKKSFLKNTIDKKDMIEKDGSLWSSYEKMARYNKDDVEEDSDSEFSFSSCLSNIGNSSFFNIDFEPCQTNTNDFDHGLNRDPGFKNAIARDDIKLTLILVVHGGSLYDYGADLASKLADVTTFRNTLSSVIGSHYPVLKDRWVMRLVPCPPVAAETLKLLTKMNPCQVDVDRTIDSRLAHNFVPLGSIPILFTDAFTYGDHLKEVVNRLNQHYRDFINSAEGENFSGAIHIVADALGSIIAHDILHNIHVKAEDRKLSVYNSPPSRLSSSPNTSLNQSFRRIKLDSLDHCYSNSSVDSNPNNSMQFVDLPRLEFKVNNVFLLGSPIGIVLAHRLIHSSRMKHISNASESNYFQVKEKFVIKSTPVEPELIDSTCETGLACDQTYNIFHRTDPGAFRVEPILFDVFNLFSPHSVPQYHRYPLGDGQSASLLELIMHNVESFDRKNSANDIKCSSAPISSTGFNLSAISKFQKDLEYNSAFSLETMKRIRKNWWGSKRIDYSVTCPEGIQNILARALPPILHASYWESKDVAAFIVRQILEVLGVSLSKFAYSADMADEIIMSEMNKLPLNENETIHTLDSVHSIPHNSSGHQPPSKTNLGLHSSKTKNKSRSNTATDRLKNSSSNHRANDVILDESQPQIINARFIYGNLDLLSLSNAQINIYLQSHSSNKLASPWIYLGKDVTNTHGKLRFCIPEQNRLGVGMHTIKLIPVLDPKNYLCVTMAIVKKGVECVVFSVDGSFAASLSIMGSDPKVHPGSVDVARHWQGLGFMIIYLSARPDMQHRKVQAWMAGHNFPTGFYYFVERVTHDPLKQKEQILRKIIKKSGIVIHCAYGSGKDITAYTSIGLTPDKILIIGKKTKTRKATNITRYSDHLLSLMNNNPLSRQANNRFNQMMSYSAFDLPTFNATTTLSPSRSTISTLLSASGTLNTINVQFHETNKNADL